MAIIEMKKLTFVAYGKDKSKLLRATQKTGCVEIQRSALLDNTFTREDTDRREEISAKLMRLQFVLDFLKAETRNAQNIQKAEKKAEKKEKKNPSSAPINKLDYNPPKKQIFNPEPRFGFEQFYEIAERIPEIENRVAELEKINSRYADIKAEITKLQNTVQQLEVFRSVAVTLSSFTDTAHTSIVLGAINSNKADVVEKVKNDFPAVYAEVGEGTHKFAPVAVIALKSDIDAVLDRLNEAEFIRSSFTFDMTAADKIFQLSETIKSLFDEKKALLEQSLRLKSNLPDFKQLYDYYTIENARLQASDGFAQTKTSFILEGWFPAKEEEKVLSALNDASSAIVIETREPVEGDSVPTLIENNKIVAPYECITNMYSVPNYRDIDPNPYVAFFYFLMFGLMMGDAVYGVMLLIGALLIYKFSKPVPGKGKIVLVIAMGGLSTIFWGVMFGGYMAFDGVPAVLFKPIDESNPNTAIYYLGLSLAIGVLQINFGMGLHAYDLIKRKKDIAGAFNEVFSWYSILIGIILLAVSMLLNDKVSNPNGFKISGIVFLCVGLALILVLGGRGKKGIGKVTGGFSQLYGGVNFLSDILSYSRLFGLGLATGVIGMVINQICGVIIDILTIGGVPILGILVAAPIFLIGHIFNIGINTLGTYVHDSRLHFIEFFSRFYEGGGHAFSPLGSNTKYTYIEK